MEDWIYGDSYVDMKSTIILILILSGISALTLLLMILIKK